MIVRGGGSLGGSWPAAMTIARQGRMRSLSAHGSTSGTSSTLSGSGPFCWNNILSLSLEQSYMMTLMSNAGCIVQIGDN